jgi:hypothetical protein
VLANEKETTLVPDTHRCQPAGAHLLGRSLQLPVSETAGASRLHDVHPHPETVALDQIPDPIHVVSHGSSSFDVFLWLGGSEPGRRYVPTGFRRASLPSLAYDLDHATASW